MAEVSKEVELSFRGCSTSDMLGNGVKDHSAHSTMSYINQRGVGSCAQVDFKSGQHCTMMEDCTHGILTGGSEINASPKTAEYDIPSECVSVTIRSRTMKPSDHLKVE